MRGNSSNIRRSISGATLIVAAIIGSVTASQARAQCTSAPLSIQVQTTGTYMNTCAVDPVTNRWNVTVTVNGPVTSNSTVTIRGANTLMLGKVTIQNNSAIDCRVNILGSGFDQRIGGVGFIDKGTSGPDKVLLLQLNTAGDVGYDRPGGWAIHTDMIANLSIGGNVLGSLVSDAYGRTMTNVYVQGDLRGSVSVGPLSSIHSLWVGGNLGMPDQDPVRVYVSGNILNLTAGAINADMSLLENGASGQIHSLEVTTGNLKGSIRCHRLGEVVGGAGTPRFHVAGNLDAGMTITRDIRVPFFVGGSYTAARTISGSLVPNVITTGTGQFDNPAADPSDSMLFQGDFAGAMTLGTPIAAGLASINRNININGSMTGSITTTQDLDAGINIGGELAGRVEFGGGVRSGRTILVGSPLTGEVSVGGSLLGNIVVPGGGLSGQVIVNAANVSGGWSGMVSVGGSNPFTPIPTYIAKSSNIGGGAVGVAPFQPHYDDCTPAHDSTGPTGFVQPTAFAVAGATPVIFRSYGPVQPTSGFPLSLAVAVEQYVNGTWTSRSNYFNIAFKPAGSSGRQIALSSSGAGQPPVGQYRMRPVALQCARVAGSPAPTWSSPYLFRIETDCNNDGQGDQSQIAASPTLDADVDGVLDQCQAPPACPCDVNGSGGITVQDVFDFLAFYFQAAPQADFNHSGNVTIQDVFDFLGCYFTRPAGC